MSKNIPLSLLLVALLSQANANETKTIELKPLSITSTAIDTDELRSTDAVEVYTQKDIEDARVQNLYEFLNSQTSLTTIPSYGNSFSQSLDMRGYGSSNGNQNIVITLDGRKLNNIDNVSQLLSSISPSSVSKIEIIKSSGIVLGGDGANAGTINITSKKNNDKEVSIYAGTQKTYNGSVYLGHSDDTLSVSISAQRQATDGIQEIDAQGTKDANSLNTGTFNLSYTPTNKLELRLGASTSKYDVIYTKNLTKAQYEANPKEYFGGGTSHQVFHTNALSAGISYYINEAMSINFDADHEKKDSAYVPSTSISYYQYDSAKASLDYIKDDFSFIIGTDLFYGTRKASNTTTTTTKNNAALFMMGEMYMGNNTFKAGYRLEEVSYKYNNPTKSLNQSDKLTGVELGYNYKIDKESSFFFNYSHSYQAPNIDNFFVSTYGPAPTYTPTTEFNEFIDPMSAHNFTLGYNNITSTNKFKVSLYYIDLKNEIYYHKVSALSGTNTNIDKSHKYGLEAYNKYLFSQEFNIALNYNYVQAIIDDEKEGADDYSGKELPGVSNHSVKATLNYLPNKHTLIGLTQVYRSEAYAAEDFHNNFTQKQDKYMSTDISATFTKDNYEVFAKINNLFNQKNAIWIRDDAIYPVNYTTTATVGLKVRF